MKKVVKIEGLHCPNCARNLQNELSKINGVENLEVDVVKATISFESKNTQKSLENIIKLTKKLEPDVKIIDDSVQNKSNKGLVIDIVTLIVGLALSVVCLTVSMSPVIFWIIFVTSALLFGYKTYIKAFRLLVKGVVNENLLLTISVVGAAILGEYMESLMVIALYSIGKIFEGLAVTKSRNSIQKLTNLQPEYAVVLKDEKEVKCDPKEVSIGSILIVKPGERVAIDGKIILGTATLDTQSLTGESLPQSVALGDEVLSGSIVLDGVLQIETTCLAEGSTVARIMNLIEHASEKKSKTETVISKITRWYTLGVIICACITFGIVWAVTNNINTAVYRGLIFLVVSCPCAFAISVPLTYFSGIGNASRHGVLVKGSNYLDALSKLDIVAFDKTGTITTGMFVVEKIKVINKSYSKEDILWLASLGEQNSIHPLAKSIVAENKKELVSVKSVKEVAGKGIYFSFEKDKYFVGRKSANNKETVVELFKNDEKIGEIYLVDKIKDTSKTACEKLKKLGIKTVLLSGDNAETVNKVSKEVEISEAFGEMLPQDKFDWIKTEKEKLKQMIGYVGDGINDSPSLMLADVGISMGINGSPASIEASDVVLVDDNPEKIISAIKISKKTGKIVWQNIILSALIKFAFLALGAVGITGMLSAVFADVGVTVLAILNSMRALIYSPTKKK
ncbi:MAG: cadmium-translocating P-type ATPase [Clostridiales bacterium]|nr:cadmium-translocating P-type ATPase [Clostridiales bacterium]